MTRSKTVLTSTLLPLVLLIMSSFFPAADLSAQDEINLRLSVGATAGYAPQITHGSTNNAGVVAGVYGELEYGKAIGRLQFTKPLLNTFEENNNLDDGEAYHGSLGYSLDSSSCPLSQWQDPCWPKP